MISTSTFFGGAVDVPTSTSTHSITDMSTRVHRTSWTSGTREVTLPPLGDDLIAEIDEAGPMFYVINDGTVSFSLTYVLSGAQATTTVAAGKTAIVLVSDRVAGYHIKLVDNA